MSNAFTIVALLTIAIAQFMILRSAVRFGETMVIWTKQMAALRDDNMRLQQLLKDEIEVAKTLAEAYRLRND